MDFTFPELSKFISMNNIELVKESSIRIELDYDKIQEYIRNGMLVYEKFGAVSLKIKGNKHYGYIHLADYINPSHSNLPKAHLVECGAVSAAGKERYIFSDSEKVTIKNRYGSGSIRNVNLEICNKCLNSVEYPGRSFRSTSDLNMYFGKYMETIRLTGKDYSIKQYEKRKEILLKKHFICDSCHLKFDNSFTEADVNEQKCLCLLCYGDKYGYTDFKLKQKPRFERFIDEYKIRYGSSAIDRIKNLEKKHGIRL